MSTSRRYRGRTTSPSDFAAYDAWRTRLSGGGGGSPGTPTATILIGGEGGGAAGQYPAFITSSADPDTWESRRMTTNASSVVWNVPKLIYTGAVWLAGGVGSGGSTAKLLEGTTLDTDTLDDDVTSRLNNTSSGTYAWRMATDGAGNVAIHNEDGVIEYSTNHGAAFFTHTLANRNVSTVSGGIHYFSDHPTWKWWTSQLSTGKVWRTNDISSWSEAGSDLTGVARGAMAYDVSTDILAACGGSNTVEYTTNDGTSWSSSTSGLTGLTNMRAIANNKSGTWVCTGSAADDGIFYTTNISGGSWSASTTSFTGYTLTDLAWATGYGFIALGFDNSSATMRIWTSSDGDTWTEKTITNTYANTSTSNYSNLTVYEP